MNRKVMNPHHEDRDVDGQHPEHEDEDGMCVVVEIIVGARPLRMSAPQLVPLCGINAAYRFPCKPQRPRAGCYLYNACYYVCELIRNERSYQEEKNGGGNDSPLWRTGGEDCGCGPPVASVSKSQLV